MSRIRVWIRLTTGAALCSTLILAATPAASAAPRAAGDSPAWSAWVPEVVAHIWPWKTPSPTEPRQAPDASTTIGTPEAPTAADKSSCDPAAERSCTIDPDG